MPPTAGTRSNVFLSRFSRRWIKWGLLLGAGLAVAVGCSNNDNGTGVTPDYSLSLAPAALSIAPGANGNTAVTLTRTEFRSILRPPRGAAPPSR